MQFGSIINRHEGKEHSQDRPPPFFLFPPIHSKDDPETDTNDQRLGTGEPIAERILSGDIKNPSERPERNPLQMIQKNICQNDKDFHTETEIEQPFDEPSPAHLNRERPCSHDLQLSQ